MTVESDVTIPSLNGGRLPGFPVVAHEHRMLGPRAAAAQYGNPYAGA